MFQLFKLHLLTLDPYKTLGGVLSETLISSMTAVRQMAGRWGGGRSLRDTLPCRLALLVLYLKSGNVFPLLDKHSGVKSKGMDEGGENLSFQKSCSNLIKNNMMVPYF